ncbi:hypothetical protein [Chromobacterium aquaticum]|uniref:Uncharacterized protein n=1 Tax=Chromobacterium aquaticum TaxID=467180 RepID=A0ABV9A0X1_9NEIS|nr:hypothetical protein [Chromobacterium aquaticum]MCD5362746.1 hypothetical protein [Chromobacterium aquaticum]
MDLLFFYHSNVIFLGELQIHVMRRERGLAERESIANGIPAMFLFALQPWPKHVPPGSLAEWA